VNIGRRLENNLVIDDPRVSRNHALLRANNGRYMLCDLNSSGGTYVNGLRITQQALRPGDVISLAGVSIIYGEESGSDPYSTDGSTTAITPPPSHKP
jgi:pSer/pThr/pTyr-binding forkhead associated (FHA) protein